MGNATRAHGIGQADRLTGGKRVGCSLCLQFIQTNCLSAEPSIELTCVHLLWSKGPSRIKMSWNKLFSLSLFGSLSAPPSFHPSALLPSSSLLPFSLPPLPWDPCLHSLFASGDDCSHLPSAVQPRSKKETVATFVKKRDEGTFLTYRSNGRKGQRTFIPFSSFSFLFLSFVYFFLSHPHIFHS